ncbi:hypothetical protein CR983_03610 [Candidatus Saccharibacteria bacterium]|nr:MAG: hypothetical protein CR983_03610 [Candidatus Saccharibacteria bacterium]
MKLSFASPLQKRSLTSRRARDEALFFVTEYRDEVSSCASFGGRSQDIGLGDRRPDEKKGTTMSPLPPSSVTLRFGSPVTGKQIAALLRQSIRDAGMDRLHYAEERSVLGDKEVLTCGQRSKNRSEHCIVKPSGSQPYLYADEAYDSVLLEWHLWPIGRTFLTDHVPVVDALKATRTRLEAAHGNAMKHGFPEYRRPRDI